MAAAGGFALGRGTDPVTTSTETVTVRQAAGAGGLPRPVADTRRKLLAAAAARDWDGLRRIIGGQPVRYTFGPDVPGGPIAFWRAEERRGAKPLESLEAVLKMPYTLSQGLYVWPFAYSVQPGQLTPYELRLLSPVASADQLKDGYLGWRAGIAPDGRWQFFVRGD